MNGIADEKLKKAATNVFDGTDVVLAYAYGSRVHGNPRPESDLDIGYYLRDFHKAPPLAIRDEMMLAVQLEQAADLDVDLRNLAEAPLELKGRILEEGVRIYCSDEVMRVNLERDTLSRYHDYKDIFREMHETRLRNLAKGTSVNG